MLHIWKNRVFRDVFLQAAYVAVVLTIILVAVFVGGSNMGRLGANGYDFLFRTTGWTIPFSVIGSEPTDPYWHILLAGLLNTLFLATISLSLATLLGVLIGVARTSANDLANLLGSIYVELFRNIPLILQVLFWYAILLHLPATREALTLGNAVMLSNRGAFLPIFDVSRTSALLAVAVFAVMVGVIVWVTAATRFRRMESAGRTRLRLLILAVSIVVMAVILWVGRVPGTPLVSVPALKGLSVSGGLHVPTALLAMIVSMATFGAAYIGEIVRGGFQSIGKGQLEAAHSLGLSSWQTLARIRLPLAIRAMLPSLTNQYVWLVKATTLSIAVGFADFFMVISTSINQAGRTIELIGILIAGFLLINFTLARILNKVNRAIALKGDSRNM